MVETPNYEVTRKLDDVEIRKYPALFLATAKGDADLFGLLFRYITGANSGSKKISMTAPVITPEKIAMTSPVVTDADTMSFIVPSTYTRETIPEPTDPHITIQEQPNRSMAVLKFSGWARSDTVDKKKKNTSRYAAKKQHRVKKRSCFDEIQPAIHTLVPEKKRGRCCS